MAEIINRVASSPLITIDPKEFVTYGEREVIDLSNLLFQGLILRETDIRNFVKETNWATYIDKHVAIMCSTDAIIPSWAYMLIATSLSPYASTIIHGTLDDLEKWLYLNKFSKIDFSKYQDKKVVLKGCSDIPLPSFAYVELSKYLFPYVSSIMYGEPCSTVPIFKRRQ